jgi:tetratricopeptide (TPR) repeat protein
MSGATAGFRACFRGSVVFAVILCLYVADCDGDQAAAGRTDRAKTTQMLGRLFAANGKFDKAEMYAHRALRLARDDGGDSLLVGLCLLDLAYYSKELGYLERAGRLCLESLEFFGDDQRSLVMTAAALRLLSDVFRRQGRLAQAEAVLIAAIDMMSDSDLPIHQLGPYYAELGRLRLMMGQFQAAQADFTRARELIIKSFGREHFYTKSVFAGSSFLTAE